MRLFNDSSENFVPNRFVSKSKYHAKAKYTPAPITPVMATYKIEKTYRS